MITYAEGNLLNAEVEALVNTVNTAGVMGKGIALMFKEAFPENFQAYAAAVKRGEVRVGEMFVTARSDLLAGPRWIVNFPTKQHWRSPSRVEWIESGLDDLRKVIEARNIRSIAIPPLGSGNGGLDWRQVRPLIERALSQLEQVDIVIYEPTSRYQNVAKRTGVEKLTPVRALIADIVRRYWVLGFECSLLEVQKLTYFLERYVRHLAIAADLGLGFQANRFGPYSTRLRHVLDGLDGSYLHCDKRLADAHPSDPIRFERSKKDKVTVYLSSGEAKPYRQALEATADLIDGFESPLGMELLATVDWLVHHEGVDANIVAIREGLLAWPGGEQSGERKAKLFDERLIGLALERLQASGLMIQEVA